MDKANDCYGGMDRIVGGLEGLGIGKQWLLVNSAW